MKAAQYARVAVPIRAPLVALAAILLVPPAAAAAISGPRAKPALQNGEFSAELNGLNLWYKVAGTGPICLMPTPAWGPSSDLYFRTLKPMEKFFTMVYLDSRGTGRSQRAKSAIEYSWDHLIADLEALRLHLKQHKIWLIGHSEGGTQILHYACRYPDRVSGLILLDAAPVGGGESQSEAMRRAALRKDQPWYAEAVAALRTPPKTGQEFAQLMGKALPLFWSDPGKIDQFKEAFAATTFSVEASQGQDESRSGPFDLRAQLKKVTAPALIVVGTDDFICSPVAARDMHLGLQNSKLLVIERCGHFPWLEQADEFNGQVPRFLEALGFRH
jgi:proline iminopeptidase